MSLLVLCRALVVVAISALPSHAASAALRAQLTPAVAPSQAFMQEEGSSAALFRDTLSVVERDLYAVARKVGYPLPVVYHDKDAASGYNEGSPLYEEQQRWVERNGDNSLPVSGGAPSGRFAWVPSFWRPFWEQCYYQPVSAVAALIFQIFISVLFAWLYLKYMPIWRKNHMDLPYHQSNEADWRHSPWDVNCANDWQLCLWGFCCPYIRWADTITNVFVMGQNSSAPKPSPEVLRWAFWRAFAFMLILSLLAPLTFGISLVVAILIAVQTRQTARVAFRLSPGDPRALLYDTLLWCCCPFCALMQEARQVEESAIQEHNDQFQQESQQFA